VERPRHPGRLPAPPERDQVSPENLHFYDEVRSRQARLWQGAPTNSDRYFGALLNSPPLARTQAELGRFMRMGGVRGTYSDADREFVDMVLGVEFAYNAILFLHLPDAIAVGVRLEAIEAVWSGDDAALTADEQLLARYIRAVARGAVDDESFAALVDRSGVAVAVEYTAFITFLISTFRLWQALGVPDVKDEEVESMLAAYRVGTGPTVDPQARIG
jgi:hypothetical protein